MQHTETREAAINIRALRTQRDLIDKAATMRNKTRSDFMLEAACQEAESENAKAFYLRHDFLQSPVDPMTLMLNLQDVQHYLQRLPGSVSSPCFAHYASMRMTKDETPRKCIKRTAGVDITVSQHYGIAVLHSYL